MDAVIDEHGDDFVVKNKLLTPKRNVSRLVRLKQHVIAVAVVVIVVIVEKSSWLCLHHHGFIHRLTQFCIHEQLRMDTQAIQCPNGA